MYCSIVSSLPIPFLQPAPKEKEIDTDPSWGEILRRLRRITPYLWPKKSRSLQLIAVCPDSLLTTKTQNSFLVTLRAHTHRWPICERRGSFPFCGPRIRARAGRYQPSLAISFRLRRSAFSPE